MRTQLGCKFRHNESNDLGQNVFSFLQLIFELKRKNRRLVLTLIASRQQSVLSSLHLLEKYVVAGQRSTPQYCQYSERIRLQMPDTYE